MSEHTPMDPQQAAAVAEAMLEQPRAKQARRSGRSRPMLRWRRLVACWFLGLVAGRLFGELVQGDGFVSSVLGVAVGGVVAMCLDLHHHRRGRAHADR